MKNYIKTFLHTPLFWFIVASSALFAAHYQWNIIRWNYYVGIHFYWGLVGMLIAGYWPLKIDFTQLFRKKRGEIADIFEFNFKWSFNAGLVIMLFLSIDNEVFNDPEKNGIPFMDAWQHLAADLSGLALFCIIYFWNLKYPIEKF